MLTLRDQLIRHEGLKLKPYKDTVGKLTIGVGRNLDDVGISRAEAMMLLDNDILAATNALVSRFPWAGDLDWPRKSVLINMVFNLGIERFAGFHLTLLAMQDGRYEDASKAMLDSKWAEQVGDRAKELSKIILTGEMGE